MGTVVAVIPARGGSKGIPRKNLYSLGGRPLIAYSIEAGLGAQSVDRVIVSTDDSEIAAVSREWGAEVPFLRPAELALDETPTLPVIQHSVQILMEEDYIPSYVVILQPTSPLRSATQIDEGVQILSETGADSVVSVCISEHSPYWMRTIEEGRVYPFLAEGLTYLRRQDLPIVYRLNGALWVTRREVLMEGDSVYGEDVRPLVMPVDDSVDIDTPTDVALAELILGRKR